jgi:hypothetical protein
LDASACISAQLVAQAAKGDVEEFCCMSAIAAAGDECKHDVLSYRVGKCCVVFDNHHNLISFWHCHARKLTHFGSPANPYKYRDLRKKPAEGSCTSTRYYGANATSGLTGKSGIKYLVYALAGYNPTAEEVVAAFKSYIQQEARKYEPEFPNELYMQCYRLYDIPVTHSSAALDRLYAKIDSTRAHYLPSTP